MGGVDTFKDMSFLLKFIAMVVNIIIFVMWVFVDKQRDTPARSFGQFVLFYHCVPPYMIVLIAFITLYLINEEPGTWAQRIFLVAGAILFLIFGIIGLINALDDNGTSHELFTAILCLIVGILLAVDIIKREFC